MQEGEQQQEGSPHWLPYSVTWNRSFHESLIQLLMNFRGLLTLGNMAKWQELKVSVGLVLTQIANPLPVSINIPKWQSFKAQLLHF